MITSVLFDLGGTLANGVKNAKLQEQSVRRVINALDGLGVKVDALRLMEARLRNRRRHELYRRKTLKEVLAEQWMKEDLEAVGVTVSKEVLDAALKAHFDVVLATRTLYDDTLPTLEGVKALNLKVGVVSNVSSDWAVNELVKRLNIARYLDVVITSAKVGYRKPHPTIFLEALKALAVTPREAVFVGDDPVSDVAGAKRVGMIAVWLNRGGLQKEAIEADYVISSLLQLLQLLKRLNEKSNI
ncbi:MAG: HAD-IA family hydrolase [Candidatus Nezhaarchaeales archaeon]